MKRPLIRPFAALAAVLTAMLLASCVSVNRLGDYRLDDAALAAVLQPPPPPSLDAWYHNRFDPENPIVTVLSVGTNIVKAAEAERATVRMRDALERVDVPALVLKESSAACAKSLGAREVRDARMADFVLDLEIEEYGIDVSSWASGVSLRLRVTARLYERGSGDLVWRRHVFVEEPASPTVFGLPSAVENILTAAMLSSLSTGEMAEGFAYLARQSARTIALRLERDLWDARSGW